MLSNVACFFRVVGFPSRQKRSLHQLWGGRGTLTRPAEAVQLKIWGSSIRPLVLVTALYG